MAKYQFAGDYCAADYRTEALHEEHEYISMRAGDGEFGLISMRPSGPEVGS